MTTSLLDKILSDPEGVLSVRFQPIFHLGPEAHQIYSLEGLVRGPSGSNFERADILFDYVRRKHAEIPVDHVCIAAICRAVTELPTACFININVHATTLGQSADFVDFFQRCAGSLSLPLERFTLEIVEHSPTHNIPGLISSIRQLRSLGVRIALDDVGLGNSNYQTILDCHPDYFKLDAFFVREITHDPCRRAVVRSIMCLSEEMKGIVIAEGVQNAEDLSTLLQLGVQHFQANILCPAVTLQETIERVRAVTAKIQEPVADVSPPSHFPLLFANNAGGPGPGRDCGPQLP